MKKISLLRFASIRKMQECSSKYFINNGSVVSTEHFDERLVFEGQSLYDVMKVKNGIPLFYENHYQRIVRTSQIINLHIPISETGLLDNIKQLISTNQLSFGNVKVVINYNAEKVINNLVTYFVPHRYPTAEEKLNGVETLLFKGIRENPNAKIIRKNLREATENSKSENNVYEVILIDNEGFITEGSRTNVFFIKDNDVFTTPIHAVLPGITRFKVIEILKSLHISFIEKVIHFDDINNFESFFITGTSPGVLAVRKFENIEFNIHNSLLQKVIQAFDVLVENYISAHCKV